MPHIMENDVITTYAGSFSNPMQIVIGLSPIVCGLLSFPHFFLA